MQRIFEGHDKSYLLAFKQALEEIKTNGAKVSPRGQLTKEISPAMMVVDPLTTVFYSKVRKLNYGFLMAENLWYLSGRADTFLLSHYNSNIKNFAADGLHEGAYGPKIVAQIRYVVETLQKDPDSRQAIITLWRENPRPSKDVPCTTQFQFMIRDNKVNLYVVMRSNDIILGNCYDVPSFSLLLNIISSCLGLEIGTLYHTANSLHLYEMHFDLADGLLNEENSDNNLPWLKCPHMSLEDHVYAWDLLSSYEAACRNLSYFASLENSKLNSFYLQYAYTIGMYNAKKIGNTILMLDFIQKLKNIQSPLGIILDAQVR